MAKSISSIKKGEGFSKVGTHVITYLEGVKPVVIQLKEAANSLAVPVIDDITNSMITAVNGSSELCLEAQSKMVEMCKQWKDRPGFGAANVQLFEDTIKTISQIQGYAIKEGECEEHDGIHENVNDENVAAFRKALTEIIEVKNPLIFGIKDAMNEYGAEDTEEIYMSLGAGIEKFFNAVCTVIANNQATLNSFNINLDDSVNAIQSTAGSLSDVSASAQAKLDEGATLK